MVPVNNGRRRRACFMIPEVMIFLVKGEAGAYFDWV
jgi:hypothetical protein